MGCAMTGFGSTHAGAVLEIDLGAIVANWLSLRARLGTADCGAVLKADAYGLGAAMVGPALAEAGARRFFVAHLDEAIALRHLLPVAAEVYVLNGLPAGAEADCAAHGIVPVLNSPRQIAAWAAEAARLGRALPGVVQVDSGMSRMGLAPAEVARIAEDATTLDGIALRFVMSHLACAEDSDHEMNRRQLARFEAARRMLPPAPASLANSSGIFLGRDYHFDLARPGAALYGLAPVKGAANPMRPVARLLGRVVQTREIAAGEVVGYGASWTAPETRRIATVSVGYADGYGRALSNGALAYSGETPVPLVGIVSMDTITFDVTQAPGAVEGAYLELIGTRNPIETLAANAGTIGYEILTSLGNRYARSYADAQFERLIA